MIILKELSVNNDTFKINGSSWCFPYKVYELIEMEDRIIVNFNSFHLRENPQPWLYFGCTIWCYNKSDKQLLWVVEEPPLAYDENGEVWNRGISKWLDIDRNECYMGVHYDKDLDKVTAHTSANHLFSIDHNTGKVTFVMGGLR